MARATEARQVDGRWCCSLTGSISAVTVAGKGSLGTQKRCLCIWHGAAADKPNADERLRTTTPHFAEASPTLAPAGSLEVVPSVLPTS